MLKIMRYFLYACSLVVGSVFIVSGLIKVNDILGFSYKLEEYFSPQVLNWTIFYPYATPFSAFMAFLEVFLGASLVMRWKLRYVTYITFALTIFFGFLTFYSAYFDVVKDCGCFGDAMKGSVGRSLTPWESFSKDMILFALLIPLVIWHEKISEGSCKHELVYLPISLLLVGALSWVFDWFGMAAFWAMFLIVYVIIRRTRRIEIIGMVLIAVLTLLSMYITYEHLPFKDYLPYAEGKNLRQEMKTCAELNLPCTEMGFLYRLKNKKTGELLKIDDRKYMEQALWQDTNWEMQAEIQNIVYTQGYEPSIHDFVFFDEEGQEMSEEILSAPNIFVLIAYNLQTANWGNICAIKEAQAFAEQTHAKFVLLTASSWQEIKDFKETNNFEVLAYQGDGTTLKTVIRANPGLVQIKSATVVGKWHYNDIPAFNDLH